MTKIEENLKQIPWYTSFTFQQTNCKIKKV